MKCYFLLVFGIFLTSTYAFADNMMARFESAFTRVCIGGPPQFTPDFILADAVPDHRRRFTNFSGDVSGRFIEAISAASEFSGKSYPILDEVVEKALNLQKPDGHWGDPFTTGSVTNSDMALLWGNGRMLVGLIKYHDLKKNPDVLNAAKRLGDCFVELAPRLNTDAVQKEFSDKRVAVGYICWIQTIEGLAELARASGESKYSELAQEVASRIALHPSQHSHGFITSLRGMLALHQLTDKPELLTKVEKEWQAVIESGNVFPHGALPEAFKPDAQRDEGCSEADWLRLNLELWKLTRKPQYLEQAELTLFNEFSFNQFASGDFGHHALTATGSGPTAARAWWCCTFHGLRAFPDIFKSAFLASESNLVYSLPVSGHYEEEGFMVRAKSRLEKDSNIELEIIEASADPKTIAVRIPRWASKVTLTKNGLPMEGTRTGSEVSVHATWKPMDQLVIDYDLKTNVMRQPGKPVTIFRGPWLLGADDESSPHWFDEPSSSNRLIFPEIPPSTKIRETEGIELLSIPVAHWRVEFAPGGYPMQQHEVVLRPIAEKTMSADQSRWDFLFKE